MKAVLIIIVVLVLILFVAGWTIGANRGEGRGNAEETRGTANMLQNGQTLPAKIGAALSAHFPQPSIDLCLFIQAHACDDRHSVLTIKPPGISVDIREDKKSRKLEVPEQPAANLTLKYFDSNNEVAAEMRRQGYESQEWPCQGSCKGSRNAIAVSKDGGKLLLICNSLAPCTLKLK